MTLKALSAANVQQKLRRILKAVGAQPMVVDRKKPTAPRPVLDGIERTGEAGTVNRKQIQDAFFIVLLVGLSVAFIRLLAPYLVAVAVAVILALLLRHPLNWLLRRGVARGLATALVVGGSDRARRRVPGAVRDPGHLGAGRGSAHRPLGVAEAAGMGTGAVAGGCRRWWSSSSWSNASRICSATPQARS